jgi:hypothetical protein
MRNILSDGLDFLAHEIGRAGPVFDVDAHDTGSKNTGDEPCHRARIIRIAGLDVNSERHPNDARNVASCGDQLIDREWVPVRIAARPSEPRARGRNRLRTQTLNQPRTTGIPGVRQEQ